MAIYNNDRDPNEEMWENVEKQIIMKLYQMVDIYGDEIGLVQTTASYETVKGVWKQVYEQSIAEDVTYLDLLTELLKKEYPETDRLFIDETIEP